MNVMSNTTDACRYHRAAQGLREESRLLAANQMTLTPRYDQRRGIVTDLLHLLVTSEEPAHYIKSFEHLAAWVDSSLDQYKVLLPKISIRSDGCLMTTV